MSHVMRSLTSEVPVATAFPLAIVVPAYKGQFLHAALTSLKRQTDQRFQLYVCDDASPDDLSAIHRQVFPEGGKNRSFVRFEANMGGRSLVGQWNRCVAQTDGEPWIWLFSDDDMVDDRCVARYYQALDSAEGGEATNVYRFNTATINASGLVKDIHPPHPFEEKAVDFAYHRLSFQRQSFVSEYIFRRTVYEQNGGFVDFPFALGSDDASWIVFTAQQPIITLSGALVYWRLSEQNMSLLQGPTAIAKLLALADFSCWMQTRFHGQSPTVGDLSIPSGIEMGTVSKNWFERTLWSLAANFGYRQIPQLAQELRRRGFDKQGWGIRRLSYMLLRLQAKTAIGRVNQVIKAGLKSRKTPLGKLS